MRIAIGIPNTIPGVEGSLLLEWARRAWRGEPVPGTTRPVTPAPVRRSVPILFGGSADAVVARTVRWGAGWSGGGGGLETAGQMFERVQAAWREAGREGKPELRALSYF